MKSVIAISALVASASAFPFLLDTPGVDSSLLGPKYRNRNKKSKRQQSGEGAASEADCPYNANHVPAAAWNPDYPYNYAYNGSEGKGVGGYQVPAPGDTDHEFIAPTSTDIRGPCPGLNTAANHGFLARDGVTTFNELVDAQQNLYNVGYDLAMLLATLGLTTTDGDLVTEKLSIGCDATSRTSYDVALTGSEPGLDGHNKFEADSSLTRNDFFTDDGDNFSFNGTLFGYMTETTGGNYDRAGLATYRQQRWNQSLAENEEFFFGPLSLLLYGAASFLYELMPSGPDYTPDVATISSFFGAEQASDGSWSFNNAEQIPANWYNRIDPYTNNDVTLEIVAMYSLAPVEFGGATGSGSFDALPDFGSISGGYLESDISAEDTSCLLYQLATMSIPGYANSVVTPTVDALAFVAEKLGATDFANLGCSTALTKKLKEKREAQEFTA